MNLENLCYQAIDTIKSTGDFIRRENRKLHTNDVQTKGHHDYVTYVDKTAERLLTAGLLKLLPGSGFITEEDTIKDQRESYTWIIDPLDGTTNYIHSVPVYSISVALQYNEKTVIGIVYEISRDECFYAWQDSPAYLNNSPVHVSKTSSLDEALLATGFPYYDYSRISAYMEFFVYLLQNTRGIRRLGSAAVDLAYVACGRFDGFYEYSLHAWDVAAGAFLVQQAGGKVCDFKGGADYLFGAEIIATNNSIHKTLKSALQRQFN
ncbi:MAG: inositol monophosphatase family protein [Bacteroidales bacterium]